MTEPPSPSSNASFPPLPRSHEHTEVSDATHPHSNVKQDHSNREDVLLTTGESPGVHSRRRRTPVAPNEQDVEAHQRVVLIDVTGHERKEEQPVLANFVVALSKPQPQSFKRGLHPVTELVWQDLSINSRANRKGQAKTLLSHVDGKLSYGLTALMGPSGSGKTTLLNCLACRLDVSTTQEGDIWLNGEKYSNAELKRVAGYVMQDDLLNGHLTV